LSELQPRKYRFKHDDFPGLDLPTGQQYGLIAQEAKEVLPEMVRSINMPDRYSDKGELIAENPEIAVVNYDVLIPLLVQASKEQDELIAQQQNEIAELRNMINAQSASEESISKPFNKQAKEESTSELDLSVQPNPLTNDARISWKMVADEQVSISIFSAEGVLLRSVYSGHAVAGANSIYWNAADLSSGSYIIRLDVNGKTAKSTQLIIQR